LAGIPECLPSRIALCSSTVSVRDIGGWAHARALFPATSSMATTPGALFAGVDAVGWRRVVE